MKGHIRERSPGHYAIILDVRDPVTGKRKRKWHSFAGTKRQAQVKCAELVAAAGRGDYIEPSKATWPISCARASTNGRPPVTSPRAQQSASGSFSNIRSRHISAPRCCASCGRSTSSNGIRRYAPR